MRLQPTAKTSRAKIVSFCIDELPIQNKETNLNFIKKNGSIIFFCVNRPSKVIPFLNLILEILRNFPKIVFIFWYVDAIKIMIIIQFFLLL
jgi:hypothetical protein